MTRLVVRFREANREHFRVRMMLFMGSRCIPFSSGHVVTYDEIQTILIPAFQQMATAMRWTFTVDFGHSRTHARRQAQ